jgi:manganese efflux pump family protein
MEILAVILIAVGLGMDTFAISIVAGSVHRTLRLSHALRMASLFGGFQVAMPIIGFLAGRSLEAHISPYDHWVAFGILLVVGSRMIWESARVDGTLGKGMDPSKLMVLLPLAVATSIDALAVGVTLSLVSKSIILTAFFIGWVTFALSYAGVVIGKRFGHFFESKIEIIGGLILIGIGLKILIQHLMA